ncbi:MAG: methylated-DNA--[protein]-cysteine S-methyltransferase [Solirubrobacterales bacterium]
MAAVSRVRGRAPLGRLELRGRPLNAVHEVVASPVGDLLLVGDGSALTGLHMQEGPGRREPPGERRPAARPFAAAREQLAEYFAGRRTRFDLPLAAAGTPFQRRVWAALEQIPFGETAAYGELATRLGAPAAARAVGAANGRNPISIVVPCHRLVGRGGALTGYGGGIERKRFLLALEAGASGRRSYTLLGADRQPYRSRLPGTLGGHRGNRVYGRLDCPGARRWIARGHYVAQRVFFADEATAIAAGYRPCANCMPERYRAWKAVQVAAS